jgi:hypothetical protein
MSPNFRRKINSNEAAMTILLDSLSLRQVVAMLLLACLLNYLLLPIAVFAQQTSPDSGLEATYVSAASLYDNGYEEKAAKTLEELMGNPAYEKADVGYKLKVTSLLVKCYYFLQKIPLVKEKLRQMLELDPKFNFDKASSDEIEIELVEYLEKVRKDMPPPPKPQLLLFDFRPDFDASKVVVTKIRKEKKLTIRTVPDTVPVTFQLRDESNHWIIQTIDSVSAKLLYTPAEDDFGAGETFFVDAVGRDTAKSLAVNYTVEASKKFPWTIVGGGAAVVGITALIVALVGGGGGGGGLGSLPEPPNPGTK